MFVKKTLEDELIDVFGKILNDDNDFRKRMISALAQLDDDGWNSSPSTSIFIDGSTSIVIS